MKKKLVLLVALLTAGCGAPNPEKAQFTGTWKHVSENGISGTKDEGAVEVTTDGKAFRYVSKGLNSETIQVFDGGSTLYTKYIYHPSTTEGESDGSEGDEGSATSNSSDSVRTLEPHEVRQLRFWTKVDEIGQKQPGGLIAGQDTILRAGGEKRKDGEINIQQWIDAKTGVLLKSSLSIYSSQAQTMVSQETWECTSIAYGPPAASNFTKP